jgi:hypothetical protein
VVAAVTAGALDDLDGERPGVPFTVLVGGRAAVFRPAAGPGWRELMDALTWPAAFVLRFGPAEPDLVDVVNALPVWQMRALLRGWKVHHGLPVDNAESLRLAGMLAKPVFRVAAERDLWEVHRLDLTGEWRSRRWRRLLNLLDGLRRTSYVNEALAQDDELAALYLERDRGAEPAKTKRRVTEFTVEAELLSVAVDRLGDLIQAHAASKGGKPRRVDPMPRPVTAIHRARERKTQRQHTFTVGRIFGRIDEKGRPIVPGPVPEGVPPVP